MRERKSIYLKRKKKNLKRIVRRIEIEKKKE